MATFDERAARSYLQRLVDQGQVTFRKGIAAMSPRYAQRQASALYRQSIAGVPLSTQAARGHTTTPERKGGKAPTRLPASPETYKTVPKTALTTETRSGRTLAAGLRTREEVGRALREFPRDSRVFISFKDRQGRRHQLGMKGGMRPRALQNILNDSDDLDNFLAELWSKIYPTADMPEIEADSVEIVTWRQRAAYRSGGVRRRR
jgi:hypothetical protein